MHVSPGEVVNIVVNGTALLMIAVQLLALFGGLHYWRVHRRKE